MQFVIILGLLVGIHTVFGESNQPNKTYMLHLRWLPTHCYERHCQILWFARMDISRLRSSPQLSWVDETCRHDSSFYLEDIEEIPNLARYWTNPTEDSFAYQNVYLDNGACTVMSESGPSPKTYFNYGINLYKKLMTTSNSKMIRDALKTQVLSTVNVEAELLKAFGVQPKVICAQSESEKVYLHELVFCFNEASSLVNCPSDYADTLVSFNPDMDMTDERRVEQIESQILCPAEFTVPSYKFVGREEYDGDIADYEFYYELFGDFSQY